MPVQVSYPGVYIQEVSSGVQTITGVSTSTAMFVGMTKRGPMQAPTRVLSYADYERAFGNDTIVSEMTSQVRQFFLNGGQQAFVMRIANGAVAAEVTLRDEAAVNDVLKVTAREPGVDGNMLRLDVDYDTSSPESTFNLHIYRQVVNAYGELVVEAQETFKNLTMNPTSGRYVETIINQQSSLAQVEVPTGLATIQGYSLSGLVFNQVADVGDKIDVINSLIGSGGNIQISVDESPFVTVALTPLTTTWDFSAWTTAINSALNSFGVSVTVDTHIAGTYEYLRILSGSPTSPGKSVVVNPAVNNDLAVALQFGVSQGGIEVSGYANQRPAPTGYFSRFGTLAALEAYIGSTGFASATKGAAGVTNFNLIDASGAGPHSGLVAYPNPIGPMYVGTVFTEDVGSTLIGSLLNVRQNLAALGSAIESGSAGMWKASMQGHRLVLTPKFGGVNADITASLSTGTVYNVGAAGNIFSSVSNVHSYSLGGAVCGIYQPSGKAGNPGGMPLEGDYEEAFEVIDRQVDMFNLMLLPRSEGQGDSDREKLWGIASSFCQTRRAMLLVDPRKSWSNISVITSEIDQIRRGIVKDHSAIFWPRLAVSTGNGTLEYVDPCGSIAGLMARTDSNRGVWKAPAGMESDLRGVRGLEHLMSDQENGVINSQAVNALRAFPNGIVSWGSRTIDGYDNSSNSDYRFIPVRRLALYIEESLLRGLRFAVFEPNDEPLWAQVRLAAGAFMNNLFRQGAFQGQKSSDAYFVKCDSETTSQNEINLGIVNVVVGFAALKPAEFVVITIKQKAGDIQV